MPAKFVTLKKYVVGDREFDTLADAQQFEVETLFSAEVGLNTISAIAAVIVRQAPALLAILRQKPRQRSSPAKTPRKARKPAVVPAAGLEGAQ
jgi:hypothetical protein